MPCGHLEHMGPSAVAVELGFWEEHPLTHLCRRTLSQGIPLSGQSGHNAQQVFPSLPAVELKTSRKAS